MNDRSERHPLVEVLEISRAEPRQQLAGALEHPAAAGPVGETWGLELEGWVAAREQPAKRLEVMQNGLRRPVELEVERPDLTDAQARGFRAVLSTLPLGQRFRLELRAVLEDKTRIELATIQARRAPLRSSYQPQLEPIVLTTLGRSGSTAVIRLLDQHPEIVAYGTFEHEPRVASYWIEVLLALSDPDSYLRQLSAVGRHRQNVPWWLGTAAPPPKLGDPAIESVVGADAVEALAGFCQQRIDAVYGAVGSERGRDSVRFFTEKYSVQGPVTAVTTELYEGAREVVLVRDFRDVVCSMLAYGERLGRLRFGREQAGSDSEFVLKAVRRGVSGLLEAWAARAHSAHLLRYEDLVREPRETIERLLRYLSLDETPAIVDRMVESVTGPSAERSAHQTSESQAASIGRWQHEMSDDVEAACEQALGAALDTFGYR